MWLIITYFLAPGTTSSALVVRGNYNSKLAIFLYKKLTQAYSIWVGLGCPTDLP